MSDPYAAFDVPEFDRIGHLMNGLYENGDALTLIRRSPAPRAIRRSVGKSRFGSATLSTVATAINWRNAISFANPLVPPAPAKVGGKTLAIFAASVNWRNAANVASPVADPTPTLDTFLAEFNWD